MLPGLVALARAAVELAEAEVAVGDEGRLPLGRGEDQRVAVLGPHTSQRCVAAQAAHRLYALTPVLMLGRQGMSFRQRYRNSSVAETPAWSEGHTRSGFAVRSPGRAPSSEACRTS